MNNKELYKIALISSPLIALFEVVPPYSFGKLSVIQLGVVLPGVVILNIIIWLFNIQLKTNKLFRKLNVGGTYYLISYVFVLLCLCLLLIVTPFTTVEVFFESYKLKQFVLSPLINLLALNSIILITINSIENHAQKKIAETRLSTLKLEAEQQQLIQQLQPHFLFNSLSTLKSYMRVDPDYAEDYLVKLSDFLRHTITIHKKQLIGLKEELQFTLDYMDLQKGRFANAFQYDVHISSDCAAKLVPIFGLQSLVENALKHNAYNESNPLVVRIYTQNEYLIVDNNKQPKAAGVTKSGYGLENLRKRYQLLSGDRVDVQDSVDRFVVKIKLLDKEC